MMNIIVLSKLHWLKNMEWVCIADIQKWKLNIIDFHVPEEIIFH